MHTNRRPVRARGRGSVTVTVETALRLVDVNARSSVVSILVDGILHLAENVIDVNEILLGTRARHGQVILLSQRVLARGMTSVDRSGSVLRHVLLSGSHGAVGDGEVAMKRHQGTANLSVGRRVNLATLGTAKKVVNHVICALSVVTAMSTVAKVLGTAIVDRGLVEVETIVGRRLRSVVAASRVTSLVCKGSCVSSHLAGVVIVARRSLRRLWPIVESALGILGWADKHRVVGMSLDVLLQILGSLERLAAELTLVRLQRNVDTDV
jgi:hypothetical protein